MHLDHLDRRISRRPHCPRLLALGASGNQLAGVCRRYRRAVAADSPERARKQARERGLWSFQGEDGMCRLRAKLPPEEGALVLAALESVTGRRLPEPAEGLPEPAERWPAARADALVAICESALASGPEDLASAAAACQMVVHVDVGVLSGEQPEGRCHLEDGTPLAAASARRLGCDAEVLTILEREGRPLDVGRRRRLPSGRQRQALQARDGECRFPGCPVPARRTHPHHLWHWSRGGPTDLENMLCLCHWHHREVRQGSYQVVRLADGGLRFRLPDGRPIEPPALACAGEAAGDLRRRDQERGLEVAAAASVAEWRGEAFDLGYAADVYLENCQVINRRAGPGP